MKGGYLRLDRRKIRDWEWYTDVNTFKVFMELLLTANFADGRFLGIEVKRGQLLKSVKVLAAETGLSYQQTRTALKHLESTGELTSKSHGKYTLFTVINYEFYQTDNEEATSGQQPINNQSTSNQQLYNNNKNNKNNKNEKDDPPVMVRYGGYYI